MVRTFIYLLDSFEECLTEGQLTYFKNLPVGYAFARPEAVVIAPSSSVSVASISGQVTLLDISREANGARGVVLHASLAVHMRKERWLTRRVWPTRERLFDGVLCDFVVTTR